MTKPTVTPAGLYGLLAEFEHPEEIVEASRAAHAAGYRYLESYTPFPLEGMMEALERPRTRLPMVSLIGGVIGLVSAYVMMYYAAVIDYPWNIAGRPYDSWPMYVPIMFELTVLGAAFGSFFGMLILNGLPRPYHPLFNVPEFKLASRDRFFLCIEARDPKFHQQETRTFLESLHPHKIYEVEP